MLDATRLVGPRVADSEGSDMDDRQYRHGGQRALRPGIALLALIATMALTAGSASAIPFELPNHQVVSYMAIEGKPAPSNLRPSGPETFNAPLGGEIFNGPLGYMQYSGGPVMPSSTNYVFKWVGSNYTGPAFGSGGGCGTDVTPVTCTDIPTGVNTYFQDLATASQTNQPNMDQVATQFVANGGAPNFNVQAGGVITDTNPYPNSGCSSAPAVAGGRCLTNTQIQTELQNFLSAAGKPAGLTNEYYVVMPQGVATCFDAAGQQCSGNASQNVVFCAYHSRTATASQYIYSNIPDVTEIEGCDPFSSGSPGGNPFCASVVCIWPNGFGDGVMSAVSHEHNESTTDPEPNNAWADWSVVHNKPGDENGDKCNFDGMDDPDRTVHSNGDGTFTPSNQTVGSHRYLVQREFSNQGVATQPCVNHYTPTGTAPPASFSTNASGLTVNFSAAPGAAQYVWQWNDDVTPGDSPQQFTEATSSPNISHAFPQAGTYTVALTAMAADGRTVASSQNVTVSQGGPPPPPPNGAPNTTITKTKIKKRKRKAKFGFRGSGGTGSLHFQAKINGIPWTAVRSPVVVKHLKKHKDYTFKVRAIDSQGVKDATPAKKKFRL
jgi:PKD domain